MTALRTEQARTGKGEIRYGQGVFDKNGPWDEERMLDDQEEKE